MGYSLECYRLSHAQLRSVFGSGRQELVRLIVDAQDKLFVEPAPAPWRGALIELVLGERGRQLARDGEPGSTAAPQPADDEEALALVALVRFLGLRTAELIHNSLAGDKFRAMFSADFLPPQFVMPELASGLLANPLCGLVHDNYPLWGGLTQPQLVRLMGGHSTPGPKPDDADQEGWLSDLNAALVEARDAGEDLVTLYL